MNLVTYKKADEKVDVTNEYYQQVKIICKVENSSAQYITSRGEITNYGYEGKNAQVKSTGCKTKYGNYQVALKSCGGTKGKTYKTIIDTNVDLVFIVASDMSMYLIPKSEIKNKSTINLCDNYIKYKIV